MAKLVVVTEGLAGRTCELKMEPISIGRLEDNAFPIPEPSVSSHHCEIFRRGPDVVVKDLNSTNGTFINGEPVTEAVLKPGQTLRLGGVEIRLEDGASPPPKKGPDLAAAKQSGVKLTALEVGSKPATLPADGTFKKKSDKINLAFIGVGIALGLIVVGLLVYALVFKG